MNGKNHYTVLEITSTADQAVIKQAYRTLSKKYHPDTNPDDASLAERFIEIKQAYEAINTPEKKRKYDDELAGKTMPGTQDLPSAASSKINDILNSFDNMTF